MVVAVRRPRIPQMLAQGMRPPPKPRSPFGNGASVWGGMPSYIANAVKDEPMAPMGGDFEALMAELNASAPKPKITVRPPTDAPYTDNSGYAMPEGGVTEAEMMSAPVLPNGGWAVEPKAQEQQRSPALDIFSQKYEKPKPGWGDALGLVGGALMDLDGTLGSGNMARAQGMMQQRADESRAEFEQRRQEQIMLLAAQGDETALAMLDPLGNRAFQYGVQRDTKEDAYRDKVWNAETQRWEKVFNREGDWRKEDVGFRNDQAAEDKRRFGLNYGLDARRTSAAEATAAAEGSARTRYLSPEELKAAGYPEGAVVQVDAQGDDQVRFKPSAEFSAGEIKGFRDKANVLSEFQRNLQAYKAAVDESGTIGFYGRNNKKAGNLDALHQALIFGAKDLLDLGILSKDDYENLNKLIPDATGMGTLGQGKEGFFAKLAPLEASISSQFGMIPEQYRSGAAGPAAGADGSGATEFDDDASIPEGAVVEDETGQRFRKQNGQLVPVGR